MSIKKPNKNSNNIQRQQQPSTSLFFNKSNNTKPNLLYKCYHCDNFESYDEREYIRHGIRNHLYLATYPDYNHHLYLPMFPNETEIEKYHLQPQGKPWEKYNITIEEADKRLRRWTQKNPTKKLKK